MHGLEQQPVAGTDEFEELCQFNNAIGSNGASHKGILVRAGTPTRRACCLRSLPCPACLPLSRTPATLARDYAELTKVRVTSLVMMTAWCGYYLGAVRSDVSSFSWGLVHTLAGVGLVAGGAAALNEVMEADIDGRMRRTACCETAPSRPGRKQGDLRPASGRAKRTRSPLGPTGLPSSATRRPLRTRR